MELIPFGLARACKDFDTDVKKMDDFKADKISRTRYESDAEYRNLTIKYCKQDVQALKCLYIKFYDELHTLFEE